jgi:hypothetical protein
MAHQFDYDADQVAVVAAKLVKEDGYLSALVSKNYEQEFMGEGTAGRPIKVKHPTTLIARSRDIDDVTSTIVLDELKEEGTIIELDKAMDYSAVPLSEADLAFNLEDFGKQVLAPQTSAVADSIEHKLAKMLLSIPRAEAFTAVYDPTDPTKYLTALRKHLRDNGVPQDGIQLTVGTGIFADFLDAKALTDVSQSGSTAALREGQVGKIRGFTVVESTRLDDMELAAFHRDAVTLVTRAPAVPAGASFGAQVSAGGYSLRYLRDYDATKTVDRSIVAAFSGVGILPTFKIERDYETRQVTTTKLDHGGVIHIDDVTVAA